MKSLLIPLFAVIACTTGFYAHAQSLTPAENKAIRNTMRKAATFYREKVAAHGGYVYFYTPDLTKRWGEGKANSDQIWVQPPGTPTVGMAYLHAYQATGDTYFRDAAIEAGEALVYGQLKSGGWAHAIDFTPGGTGPLAAQYRNGKGSGKNYSSLDDGVSQAALQFLMRLDKALKGENAAISEAAKFGLDSLLGAQFPSGGFPQGWAAPVTGPEGKAASYPEYQWKTENRIKNYWDMPTLNDGLAGTVSTTLEEAWFLYGDDRCRQALLKLADFLLAAQMPEPQPAWAQQYNHDMHPIWARKFEPPAIAGRESQDVIKTLLRMHRITADKKYLKPLPRAVAYLKSGLLADGQLARYYELKTNKPLYMTKDYELTYDDSSIPSHYGWKTESKVDALEKQLAKQLTESGKPRGPGIAKPKPVTDEQLKEMIKSLDAEGRWIGVTSGDSMIGQLKLPKGTPIVSSELFAENMTALSMRLLPAN